MHKSKKTYPEKYFSCWDDFEGYLTELGLFRMKPGITALREVLEEQKLINLPYPAIQIVGTNGKGSTATFIAALAQAHGLKAGLHTSPHFISVRERVRIFSPLKNCSELLPQAEWIDAANSIMSCGGAKLTYFELITAIAALLFAKNKVNLGIMETGLGGNFDANTAFSVNLVVFTPIALDHCDILGASITEITKDKAGAIRSETPVLSTLQSAEATSILKTEAAHKNSELIFYKGPALLPKKIKNHPETLRLQGKHQLDNAALALEAWHLITPGNSNPEAEITALQQAWLPGRLQMLNPLLPDTTSQTLSGHPPLLLDGGHNPHGLATLGLELAKRQVAAGAVIFSCLRNKNPELLIPHILPFCLGPVFVPQINGHPDAMPASELAALIGLNATPVKNIQEALCQALSYYQERLPECMIQDIHECRTPLVLCGSLYLLGEFYALYPQYLEMTPAAYS